VKLIPALFAIVCLAAPALASGDKPMSFYDLTANTLDGTPKALSDYKGKVLLVVNTASKCGFTPQYEGLEQLFEKYKDKGVVILGFPSNDFGGQEPGSNQEIASFCVNQYAVDFPMFAKTELRKNPLYAELARASGKSPQWNFHKYLIGRDGRQVLSFDTRVEPDDPQLAAAIERLLRASP
jgi:glutathione peroxidase